MLEKSGLSVRTKVKGGAGTPVWRGESQRNQQKYKLRNDRQLSNGIKMYHTHGDFNPTKFWGGGFT